MDNEIKYEKVSKEHQEEQEDENIIELRTQLYELQEESFPYKQQLDVFNHKISQLKLKIQNANTKYFQNKGM